MTVYGLILVVASLAAVWLLSKVRYWFGFDVSDLPRIAQGVAKRQADDRGRIYLLAFMADLVALVFSVGVLFGVFTGL